MSYSMAKTMDAVSGFPLAPLAVTEQDPMGPSWDRPSPISSALAPL